MAIPKRFRYDPSPVLGSGCAVNIVTGARSYGKTYAMKKAAIRDYLKTGRTWGYLRTFDQEIRDILADGPKAFFGDIERNGEFPGYELRTNGRSMEIRKLGTGDDKDGRWEIFGQFLALTKFQSYKGKTLANMHYLVYDEFIRETRFPPYPKGCVNMLINLWETLDRREDRLQIVMLANAADLVNPYFVEWGIEPPEKGKTKKVWVGNARVFVQNAFGAEFERYADKSNIGQFTKGSAYAEYAQQNAFRANNNLFVEHRPKRSTAQLNIVYKERVFGIWTDDNLTGMKFVEDKEAPVDSIVLTKEDMKPDLMMIERNDPYFKDMMLRFRRGLLRFNSNKCREEFLELMMLCGLR